MTDSTGATDSHVVSITITGANDLPTLTIPQPTAVAELANASAQTISLAGNLQIADKDLAANTLTPSQGSPTVVWSSGTVPDAYDLSPLTAGGVLTLGVPTASNGATATIGWAYKPAAVNLDFLATDQTLKITYPITVSDGFGGTDTQNLVITVTGTKCTPEW